MPRSCSASQNGLAVPDDSLITTPMSSPLPRTSSTCGDAIARRRSMNHDPSSSERRDRSSSRITRSEALPTAAPSGLPPKVEPWSPGRKTSMNSASAITADTG